MLLKRVLHEARNITKTCVLQVWLNEVNLDLLTLLRDKLHSAVFSKVNTINLCQSHSYIIYSILYLYIKNGLFSKFRNIYLCIKYVHVYWMAKYYYCLRSYRWVAIYNTCRRTQVKDPLNTPAPRNLLVYKYWPKLDGSALLHFQPVLYPTFIRHLRHTKGRSSSGAALFHVVVQSVWRTLTDSLYAYGDTFSIA